MSYLYHSTGSQLLLNILSKGLSNNHAVENTGVHAFNFNCPDGAVCVATKLDPDMFYGVYAGKGTQNGLRCRGIPITIRAPGKYKYGLQFLSLDCPLSELEISADGCTWFRLTEVDQTKLLAFHCEHENDIKNSTFENWSQASKNNPLVTDFNRCWAVAPLEPQNKTHPNLLDVFELKITTLLKQGQYEQAKEIIIKNLLQTGLCKEFLRYACENGDFSVLQLIQAESEKNKFVKECLMRSNNENEKLLLLQQIVETKLFLKSNEFLLFVLENFEKLDEDSQEQIRHTKTERGWSLYHVAIHNNNDDDAHQIIKLLCEYQIEGINWQTSSSKATPYAMAEMRECSTEILRLLEQALATYMTDINKPLPKPRPIKVDGKQQKLREEEQKTEEQQPEPKKHAQILPNKYCQEFIKAISVLKGKMNDFKRNPDFKIDPQLQAAYLAADKLAIVLEIEGNNFFYLKEPRQQDYQKFKSQCKGYINNARKVLDHHRGYEKILVNVLAIILTAGIGYAFAAGINLAMNRGRFTFFETDSSEKLFKIEECIEKITAPAA